MSKLIFRGEFNDGIAGETAETFSEKVSAAQNSDPGHFRKGQFENLKNRQSSQNIRTGAI